MTRTFVWARDGDGETVKSFASARGEEGIYIIRPLRMRLFGYCLLLTVTFSACAGVFSNDFVNFDDNIYVTSNPFTSAGLTSDGFRYALTTFDTVNWILLIWLLKPRFLA